jgi:hypothetical protein
MYHYFSKENIKTISIKLYFDVIVCALGNYVLEGVKRQANDSSTTVSLDHLPERPATSY